MNHIQTIADTTGADRSAAGIATTIGRLINHGTLHGGDPLPTVRALPHSPDVSPPPLAAAPPPDPPAMTDSLSLRPAQAADLDALTALEERCFLGDRLSRRSFRHWVRQGHTGLIVAHDSSNALAGYVLVILQKGTRLARLYSIAIIFNFSR